MKKPLALVCLVIFVDSLGYGVIVPVMPDYSRNLGVGDLGLGMLFASYALGNIVAALPFGLLSDRVGRRPFLVFGMLAMAGAFVLYAYSTSYASLFLSRFLDGVTAAANWSVGLAIIPDIYPEGERGQAMGTVMAAMGAGSIAGPALGGVLYDWLGIKAPFLLVAGVCVVGGILAIVSRDLKRLPLPESKESYVKMAGTVLAHPRIMLTLIVVMMGSVSLGVLEPLFPVHLEKVMGIGSTAIGLLFALTVLAYTVSSPYAGRLSDRRGKRNPMVLGLLATAVVAPALTFSPSLAVVIALFTLLGVTIALFETPTLPLIADLMSGDAEGEIYGTAFGLFNIAWALGYLAGPALGGFLAQKHGLPTAMAILSVPLVILAWKVWEKI
ncbi:MAG: MFS transporter [Actinomycetota bacterium]|nr:MFS transporter [Actinomycetota bacterium]